MAHLIISSTRQGPPGIANGGWLAGLLAGAAGDGRSGTTTLRRPTPVGVELTVGGTPEAGTVLTLGDQVLADHVAGVADIEMPPAVAWHEAVALAPSYVGLVRHPFPGCMVCGSARDEGDALCLRPGRLTADVVATPWIPAPWTDDGTGRAALPAVWAALDCPSAWAIDDEGRAVVLGRITARIDAAPAVGGKHVVVGWVRERTSRRVAQCGSALYDEKGAVLAVASSTWFAVDMATFAR
ncbi:MAG: hypothetical protein JWM93_3440 [Frankiales bacterium]|nr:hypothetical protein [Frankiales bacterium]